MFEDELKEKNYYNIKTKTLIKFLKEKGIYTQYCNNIIHTFDYIFSKSPEEYINFSFYWSNTPEGGYFWQTISDEWRLIVKKVVENTKVPSNKC